MKFLFYLGHPAHYHYISKVIDVLSAKGNDILLVARPKDVLLDLLKDVPYKKVILPEEAEKRNKALLILKRELKMFQLVSDYRPDVMIGTDIVITHIGKLLKIPSIVLSEDDASEIQPFVKYGYRFATTILAPEACDCSPYNDKKVAFKGCMELNYLHPNYFKPDPTRIAHLIKDGRRYFILRFAKLTAFHDSGRKGIDAAIAQKLIEIIEPFGTIYISSERALEPQFEKYRIKIKPKDMHHALYYADMYIGDSQTMAAEAAVLGTPSVRFNDFVGKLGYLEELEHQHSLTVGIPTGNPEKLYNTVEELLKLKDLKQKWAQKREKMLSSSIDVTAFWVWFFENYPGSESIVKQDKEYANRFR
jgi:predicted glycosyltransferase